MKIPINTLSEKVLKQLFLQMFNNDYLTNYGVSLEIDITPTASPTWTVLGDGFDNIAEALNEVVNQHQFLDKAGFGQSFVTGMQPIFTLTGVRKLQDAAQNFIFGKKYELLDERCTSLRISRATGSGGVLTITYNNVTMANLQDLSGGSTDGAAVNVEFHTSEKPVIEGADVVESLTVVSVAGTLAGDTAIYVNPALTGGNSYRYQVAASVVIPAYEQDMSALTAWNGTDEITAATGQEILIVEVNGSDQAIKAGKATVTAA